MSKLVGVRFRREGRVRYFDPGDLEVSLLDGVVVETDQGSEMGWVVIEPNQVVYSEVQGPLRAVLRKATPEELQESV